MTKALTMKNSEEAKLLHEYIFLAGRTQTRMGWNEVSFRQGSIETMAKRQRLAVLADGMHRITDFLSAPSNYSEIYPRATEYIRARQQGKTQQTALEMAGEVTAPFHHKGRTGGRI